MVRCLRRISSETLSSSSWKGSGSDFDFAAGKVGVFGARGAEADAAFDGEAVFVAYLFGEREGVCGVGVNDDLDEATAVAQVDEDNAAVVAATVYPAGNLDGLAV